MVPVSLRYSMRLPGPTRGARQTTVAAYVGSDTEIGTLSRVIAARGVAVRVHATEVVDAGDDHVVYAMRDGATWINDARAEAVPC